MLKLKNLSCGYQGQTILHDLNLEAKPFELLGILGPNGSGKTTLLKVIQGLIKPYKGQVLIHGQDSLKLSTKARAHLVASVPQRTQIPPDLTVQELVLLGRYAHLSWSGCYQARDYDLCREMLAKTGAEAFINRKIGGLSGGEMQRVLLALALVQETPLILLDEVSQGVDLKGLLLFFDLLEKLRQSGKCILSVMHDYNLANAYATRLLGLKNGTILFDGPKQTYFTPTYLSKLYEIPIATFKPTPTSQPLAFPKALCHPCSTHL
ncbi:MAG: ABC transporter ATP-binding protein [Desulfovibrionaceae bacterium]|nr:ABC transporter ATP-binding protein [Desulfovibrionaceae bacterium]